jgi:hypothetical protein
VASEEARFQTFTTLMNQSQQDAVDRAFEILSEHFDHVVLAVGAYNKDRQCSTTASFTGGVAPALGLCQLDTARWTREHLWGDSSEEKEGDL